ncbi:MAG: hypothetical protein ACFFE8_09105 [Candidatus Heimdallarchaeota archaeon]
MVTPSPKLGDFADISSQINELQNLMDAGILDKKSHKKKYFHVLRRARKLAPIHLNHDSIALLDQIDLFFFQKWDVPKFSVFRMNLLVLLIIPLTETLYWGLLPLIGDIILSLIIYMVVSLFLFFFSHCFFHWLTGFLVGIRFRQYFLFRSSFRKVNIFPITLLTRFPVLGIKYELGSFLKVSLWRRTLMLISPPFLTGGWFILHYFPFAHLYGANPLTPLIGGLILFGIGMSLIASFFFYGDLWKARQVWN